MILLVSSEFTPAVVWVDGRVRCVALQERDFDIYGLLLVSRRLAWFVDHVVDPAAGLLDAELPPLSFAHQPTLRHVRGHVLRQNDVSAANTLESVRIYGTSIDLYSYTSSKYFSE